MSLLAPFLPALMTMALIMPPDTVRPAAARAVGAIKPPPRIAARAKPAAAKPAAPTLPVATLQAVLTTAGKPASTWESAMVEVVASGKGRIDYENGVARAVGLGALPPPSLTRSRAQDALSARDAAFADALRTLSMSIRQVRVTSDTRVSNYTLKSDDIRLKVAEVVKGAEVVEEKLMPESGIYRVVLQAPLIGAGSVAEAVGVGEKREGEAPAAPKDPNAPGAPARADALYTGLIVDCRGLSITSCRAPKLFDGQGTEIYGTVSATPEFVDEFGIVSYPRSLDVAQRAEGRAGPRPLVIRARGVLDTLRTSPIVSNQDAQKIREANGRDRFLERAAVLFVVDR